MPKDLNEENLIALVECGLEKRYPTPCRAWKNRRLDILRVDSQARETGRRELDERLVRDREDLRRTLCHEVLSRVTSAFPCVDTL